MWLMTTSIHLAFMFMDHGWQATVDRMGSLLHLLVYSSTSPKRDKDNFNPCNNIPQLKISSSPSRCATISEIIAVPLACNCKLVPLRADEKNNDQYDVQEKVQIKCYLWGCSAYLVFCLFDSPPERMKW